MKILSKVLLLVIFSTSGYAQNFLEFKKDFNTVVNNKITGNQVDSLINKHYNLLMWFYSIDPDVKAYPLKEIRNEHIYQNNIAKLFADTGERINTLACLMAASTYDTAKIADIKNVLKHHNYKNMLAAKSLLVLGDKNIDLIAKCIIAYEFDERVQYLTIDFLHVEKSLLEKFAKDSLFSQDKRIQYLAIKAMAEIPPKPTNEQLLRQAVVKYDAEMKGWAIAALAHTKAKDILPLVKPYLNNDQLKEVSWRALAASTSAEDIDYINQMGVTKHDDPGFLNALLNSENETHLKKWLSIVKKGELPKNYFINIEDNKAIKSDQYFNDFCEIITSLTNEMQTNSLMRYFEGRKDKATTDFLNKCLTHPLAGIRENAKQLLTN